MSMGYSASFTDTISKDAISKVGKEIKALMEKMDVLIGDHWETFAQDITKDWGEIEDAIGDDKARQVRSLYKKLKQAFRKETGLALNIGFHDSSEEGDKADEVNGVYWDLDGVYEMTPQAKRLSKKVDIERKFFVNFG